MSIDDPCRVLVSVLAIGVAATSAHAVP